MGRSLETFCRSVFVDVYLFIAQEPKKYSMDQQRWMTPLVDFCVGRFCSKFSCDVFFQHSKVLEPVDIGSGSRSCSTHSLIPWLVFSGPYEVKIPFMRRPPWVVAAPRNTLSGPGAVKMLTSKNSVSFSSQHENDRTVEIQAKGLDSLYPVQCGFRNPKDRSARGSFNVD